MPFEIVQSFFLRNLPFVYGNAVTRLGHDTSRDSQVSSRNHQQLDEKEAPSAGSHNLLGAQKVLSRFLQSRAEPIEEVHVAAHEACGKHVVAGTVKQ